MKKFEYVTEDQRLFELVKEFEKLGAIAIDFEEECNLHIYGEHISIIQIYDRKNYYIVDVLSNKISNKSLEALFALDVEKLWFDCHSDLSILYKKHKIKAKNVYDLRVLAKALGDVHGLDEVLERFLGLKRGENGSKKKSQRENWMKRPIEEAMLSYALGDVEHLFDLKEVLLKECESKKKLKAVNSAMKTISAVSEGKPGWMKICNTRSLSREERIYLKNIFNARERVAERFNVPAVNVFEKKDVITLSKIAMRADYNEIEKFLERSPLRFRPFFKEGVYKAIERSKGESVLKNEEK